MAITLDGVKHSRPSHVFTRILAIIGILLLLERTIAYYQWSTNQKQHSFSAIGNLGLDSAPLSTTHFHEAAVNGSENGIRKSIIVASIKQERTQWVSNNFPDWDLNVYVVDDQSANYTVFKNAGHESSVYLTYIINHYWDLPDYMVFIHARRYQWHNDDPMYDGINPVKNLRLDHLEDSGYLSLRAAQNPGCPVGLRPDPNVDDGFWGIRAAYAKAFKKFFPKDPLPKIVGAPCCAQFAVTRAAVHSRTPADYERMRQWLWNTGIPGGRSGRVFEYLWHYIFGKPAVYCPSAPEAYCKTFGLCDLKCPNAPKKCEGRFVLAPYYAGMDKNWPREGQGQKGYPVDGWWEKFYPPEEYDSMGRLRVNATTPEEKYPPKQIGSSPHDDDDDGQDDDTTTADGEEVHAD